MSTSDVAAERRGEGEAPAEVARKEPALSEARRHESQGGAGGPKAGVAGVAELPDRLTAAAEPRSMPGESRDAEVADSSARPGTSDKIRNRQEGGSAEELGGVEVTRESGEEEGRAGHSNPEESLIEGIDMEEQRRIMHEIWVQKNLQKPSLAATQRKIGRKQSQGTPKQPRMTDMFNKRS